MTHSKTEQLMDMLLGKNIYIYIYLAQGSMSFIKVPTKMCAMLAVLATTRCSCVSTVVHLPCIKSSTKSRWQLNSFDLQEQLL